MEPRSVRLFGMSLRSDIALPGLEPEPGAVDPDVVIEIGEVAKVPEPAPEIAVEGECATLTIQGVARYRICGGSRIIVQPEPGVPEANVRLFLLGSAMGVLLHQRGLLPLHASAVEIDGRAVAFVGPSGAGKSTLASAFHDLGYRVIADDVCVVGFDGQGRAVARPGLARLRLWEETLAATGRAAGDYELSYAGDDSFRKFDVPIAPGSSQREKPLAAVFHLSTGPELCFRRIAGSKAMEVLFANTYRGEYLQAAGQPPAHWRAAIALIRSATLFELSRPRDLQAVAGHPARISELIRQIDAKAR